MKVKFYNDPVAVGWRGWIEYRYPGSYEGECEVRSVGFIDLEGNILWVW